jgi:hypothetical protein
VGYAMYCSLEFETDIAAVENILSQVIVYILLAIFWINVANGIEDK